MDVQVFKPPDIHQPSHMVSDIPYWKNQYKLLANACFEHQRAIKKSLDNNDKYMTRTRQLGTVGKQEKRFNRELRLYQDILRHQMDRLRNDALEYLELETSLKKFSDDPALKLTKLDTAYKQARDKLNSQTKLVEDIKKDYHKSKFAMEKANIKAMLATGSDVVVETRAKLDELENKTVAQLNTYTNHLDKWQAKFDILHDTAMAMETSYLRREEMRSSTVLSLLQKSVELTHSGIIAKRDPAFNGIRGRAIILEKIIKKDVITAPVFEEYVKNEDHSEQYAKARSEVDQEDGRQTAINLSELTGQSGQSDSNDLDSEDLNQRFAANKKLKHIRNTKLHLVTKSYEKQEINQLSLKIGEYVKQLLPENEDGLAFGEVVHGLLHKKKKGFYPVDHVTTVEKELDDGNLEDNGNNDNTKSNPAVKPKKTMKNDSSQSTSYKDAVEEFEVDTRNRRKHRHTRMSTPAEAETDGKRKSQAQTQTDTTTRITTQKHDEEVVKKKHKLSMFSAIAQKFRPKKSKVSMQEHIPEAELPEQPEEDIECEQRYTAVQTFVSESDSDEDENTAGNDNPKPRVAFEEDSIGQSIAGQSNMATGESRARRRRRESQHK